MKLSEVKIALNNLNSISFKLPNGSLVPKHFHVTEIGKIEKSFIDCGGILRKENKVSFQLWNANDYNHRLHPEKLQNIIELSQKALDIEDGEVEVEYQGQTVETYGLSFDGQQFALTSKQTDCLAKDNCGVPEEKTTEKASCCTPGGGCC